MEKVNSLSAGEQARVDACSALPFLTAADEFMDEHGSLLRLLAE
jgi:hypothetical protein